MNEQETESTEQKTEELIMPLIEQHQFELVDVEYVKEGGNWVFWLISISRAELPWMTVNWSAEH